MGERKFTITGNTPARVTFSPGLRTRSFEADPPEVNRESLAELRDKTARFADAMAALRADHAAARAETETLREEVDRLRAEREERQVDIVQGTASEVVAELEAVEEQPPETALKNSQPKALEEGTEIIIPRGDSVAAKEDGEIAVEERKSEPQSPEGEVDQSTEEPSEPGVEDPKGLSAEKLSREEILARARQDQSEVLLEIITHCNFDQRQGQLKGEKINRELKRRVQDRTGMPDKRWNQAWSKSLPKSGYTSLIPHDTKYNLSQGVVVDLKKVAEAIEDKKLFIGEEDEPIRSRILMLIGDVGENEPATAQEEDHTAAKLQFAQLHDSTGAKLPREEMWRLSRLMQTEILREVFLHEDFQPNGRLEGHNISGVIKERVQGRTNMSNKQWGTTYNSVLTKKKIITLEPEENNPRKSRAMNVDLKAVAALIGDKLLFTDEEDAALREKILALAEAEDDVAADAGEDVSEDMAGANEEAAVESPVEDADATSTDEQQETDILPPTLEPNALPAASNNGYSPSPNIQLSGRTRRQLAREKREREEREALRGKIETGVRPRGAGFLERSGNGDESMLPAHDEIGEQEWAQCSMEDRFMLGLLSKEVTEGEFETTNELLTAVVKAGHFGDNFDLKNLAPLIRELKIDSRPPKIDFNGKNGSPKLMLTEHGQQYLAIQFRKVRQKAIAAKQAKKSHSSKVFA